MALLTKPGLIQLKVENQNSLLTTQVNKINFTGSGVTASVGPFNDVTVLINGGGAASGVTQIIAGTNISISPPGGTGVVTINASSTTVSASYALFATSASWAVSSSRAISSSYSISSSRAISASYAFYSTSASYAETASSALNAQDILIYVKNQSGYTITKGMVVRITGSNNSSDIPRIITASYENDDNSANTLGIANETITNGNEGFVMTEGVLKGIDTNAYFSGQLLYLGATGSITGSAPVAPLHAVRLGEVVRHQSNNGSIYVRIDNGYELGELHNVIDTTTTSSYGDLLIKSGSQWINSRSLTGSYSITGSLTISGSSTFTNIGPAIFSGSVIGTSGFTGSFTGSLTGTSSYADQAGNTNTININSFSAPVESYLLMSNVVATTGVGIGGDSDLRYNSSTNVLTVPSVVSSFTGSFSGSFTGSFSGTSSWSVSSSQAISSSFSVSSSQAVSASYALSSSQAISASFSVSSSRAVSSSFAISASRAVSASWAPIFPFTGSAIISGSLTVTGSTDISNNLNVNGDTTLNGTTVIISPPTVLLPGLALPYSPLGPVNTVMFDTLNNALFITSSLPGGGGATTSGSFTGSFSGSFTGSLSGSLIGTASVANIALSATSASQAISASYAFSASYALSSSQAISSSWAISSSRAVSSSQAISASWAISSSQAVSASFALSSSQAVSASFAVSSSQAISASWAISSSRAVSASFSISSSQAISSSWAVSSSQAVSASYALSSSQALSASFAVSSSQAATSSRVNTLNQNVIITGSLAISTGSIGSGESALVVGPAPAGGTGEGGQIALLATGGTYTSSSFLDTYQDQFRIIKGPGSTSNAGILSINLQTANAKFEGAITASAYSGLPNDYLYATLNTNQTIPAGTWADIDIIFDNLVVVKGIPYNPVAGTATLTGGKVYRITARLAWNAAATYLFQYSCYDSANIQIGPTVEIVQSTNGSNNISDGTLDFIYAPGGNTDIKIRTTNNTTALPGEFIRSDLNTQFIIQQIA